MKQPEWECFYSKILEDMGYDRSEDEACVRVLKAVTMNSDLVTEDEVRSVFKDTVTVFGNAPCLESDISKMPPRGTLIASGSSVERLLSIGISPDVVVTDLDGPIGPQLDASSNGALTFIHAHGDNQDLVREYAGRFSGPVILTTQSTPDTVVADYGGFTDGDRAVCIAEEFSAKEVILLGFDFENPYPKPGCDPDIKRRKLGWARLIIDSVSSRVDIVRP